MNSNLNIKVLLVAVLTHLGANAQTAGYFGKRNFIEFYGLGNFRVFGLLLEKNNGSQSYLKENNGVLVPKRDLFDAGFRIHIGRALNNNFGVGIEMGYNFQSIPGCFDLEYVGSTMNPTYLSHEMLDIRTFNLMPKMIFTSSGGLIPIGLNHELGIGFTSSKVVQKDYLFEISNSTALSAADLEKISERFVDYDQRFGGITILYGINMRTPISRSLLFNYGLRYTLNIRNYLKDHTNGDSVLSNDEISRSIGRMRFSNFITLNVGLTYSF